MAWQVPPTFSNGNVLTAAQLNILSDDVEFLYGLVGGGINTPFASLPTVTNLTSANNQWLFYHINNNFHFLVRLISDDNNDLEIFYNGQRVYHDSTNYSGAHTYSDYIDLDDPESWSDWSTHNGGTFDVAHSYNDHEVVISAGVYYQSNEGSNLGNTPPDPKWDTLGAAAAFVTAGNYYYTYVTTDLANGGLIIVDYLLESDATSL